MEKVKSIVLLAVVLVVGLLLLLMPDKSKNYRDNGIETQVTITAKYGLKTKQYTGVYIDKNGNQVEAKVIPNKSGVYPGDVLVGYYMPEDPSNVICYGGSGLRIIMRIFGGVLCAGAGFTVYAMFQKSSEDETPSA